MSRYLWVVLDRPGLTGRAARALMGILGPRVRMPGVTLALRAGEPFAPDALLAEAPPAPMLRVMGLDVDERRGRVLREEAHRALVEAPIGPVARGGQPWPEDAGLVALSRALGAALGLAWQDHPDLSYAALARGGRLTWSMALVPPDLRVRFDGERVQRLTAFDPADAPERGDVLREGLERLLGLPMPAAPDEALVLPELLLERLEGPAWPLEGIGK